ncbi:MAG: hypothetical protein C0475_04260 [Planctomyces sp.]|nr:hypothetical protein [Planctomyces sp.]
MDDRSVIDRALARTPCAAPMPDQTPPSPGELSATITRADFARLYKDAFPTLVIIASAEVGPRDAEDVVQQAGALALTRLDRFAQGTNFRAWMAAIVRGVASNHRRSERRLGLRLRDFASRDPNGSAVEPPPGEAPNRSGLPDLPISTPASTPHPSHTPTTPGPRPDDPHTPYDTPWVAGFDPRIRDALMQLPAPQRTCLLLRAVCGNNYQQIAAILDIREPTARANVHRARAALAHVLGPHLSLGQESANG